MDTFGHEVAVKIKSAIKAKLMELNSYVDDELPDYIMVMVANKKSKKVMTSDLSLFLGENASKFCDWLDDVLKRIQAVTLETQRKTESERRGSLEMDDQEEKVIKSLEEVPNVEVNHKENQVVTQEIEVQDEILAIKADTDDLLVEELNKEDAVKVDSPINEEVKSDGVKADTWTHTKVDATTTQPEPQQRIPRNISPITFETTPPTANTEEIQSSKDKSTSLSGGRKRKAPLSTVGAILKREFPKEEEEEEEYDPRHPSIGAVASVVQVSKRRPTLPPEKQANTTLLLRAVNEAQKSVLQSSSRTSIKSDAPAATPKLFTKSYMERERLQRLHERRHEKAIAMKEEVMMSSKSTEQPPVVEEVKLSDFDVVPEEEDSPSPRMDKAVETSDDHSMESTNDTALEMKTTNRVVVLQDKVEKRSLSPEFIITLDGVESGSFAEDGLGDTEMDEELEMTIQEADADLINSSQSDEVMMEEEDEEMEDKELDNSTIRCKYWPVCKNGNQCNYHHPTIVCKTFPNCKFGNQCLYIHPNCKFDATCTRVDCPFTHASPRNIDSAPKARPVSAAPKRTPSTAVTTPTSSSYTSKIICRNFPQCKKVDCAFHHPKSCRYGQGCTRNDCMFFHPSFPAPDKMKWKAKSEKTPLVPANQITNNPRPIFVQPNKT